MTRTLRSNSTFGLRLAALAGLGLVAAPTAQAQWGQQQNGARQVIEWQGRVDKETRLYVGRSGARAQGVYSNESGGRFVSRGSLPSGSGTLYVQRISGRGGVDVIQQPYNGNGDGVIRIADTQGGADYYDVRVFWQPNGTTANGNGGYYPNGGYGNDGRNGDYGRGERNGEVERNANVAHDRNGNVVRDRHGNVVYERRGNQVLVRDRNGNPTFDRHGNPVYQNANRNNGRGRYGH